MEDALSTGHRSLPITASLLSCFVALAGCAGGVSVAGRRAPSTGDHYVAMGSSFAAGPGLPAAIEGKTDRCARSSVNYAQLMAQRRGLILADVSCSGATTAHILGPWGELPPQIDSVTANVRLVTITIGGNDVGYIGGLMAASRCAASSTPCRPTQIPDEALWAADERAMRALVVEAHRRAPGARFIFVDYLTVFPEHGTCAILGLNERQADAGRAIAKQLAMVTARVAATQGAELLSVSSLSKGHDACSDAPWINGAAPKSGVPFHPNAEGMRAIAAALERRLTH